MNQDSYLEQLPDSNEVSIISISEDQANLLDKLVIPICSLSIFASGCAVATYCLIRYYFPALADRVSFRLSFATSISDLAYSVFALSNLFVDQEGFSCSFMVWGYVFAKEKLIESLDLESSSAGLISSLPFAEQMYGYDEPETLCWYRGSGHRFNIIWQWTTLFAWLELSVLYCTGVVIAVLVKLQSAKNHVNNTIASLPLSTPSRLNMKESFKSTNVMTKVVGKVMWYPIVPLITQTPNFLAETITYFTGRVIFSLLLLTCVCAALQGLLNALVFSQDVAVSRGFLALRIHLWRKYVELYELRYPHRSCEKSILKSLKKTESHFQSRNRQSVISQLSMEMDKIIELEGEADDDNLSEIDSNGKNKDQKQKQPRLTEFLLYYIIIKILKAPTEAEFTNQILSIKNRKTRDNKGHPTIKDRVKKSLQRPKDSKKTRSKTSKRPNTQRTKTNNKSINQNSYNKSNSTLSPTQKQKMFSNSHLQRPLLSPSCTNNMTNNSSTTTFTEQPQFYHHQLDETSRYSQSSEENQIRMISSNLTPPKNVVQRLSASSTSSSGSATLIPQQLLSINSANTSTSNLSPIYNTKLNSSSISISIIGPNRQYQCYYSNIIEENISSDLGNIVKKL
ncbi:12879_t:CDS:2 [Ambispora leptoticha]|uniref:12879_t:CDS:1 n=1 Tax=Ambispora leptoticha TaxID=144679 RepID=A0A9N9FXK0_9GLOM|nr:12879_t:CDS:2 [Ambispora leptoticha]